MPFILKEVVPETAQVPEQVHLQVPEHLVQVAFQVQVLGEQLVRCLDTRWRLCDATVALLGGAATLW